MCYSELRIFYELHIVKNLRSHSMKIFILLFFIIFGPIVFASSQNLKRDELEARLENLLHPNAKDYAKKFFKFEDDAMKVYYTNGKEYREYRYGDLARDESFVPDFTKDSLKILVILRPRFQYLKLKNSDNILDYAGFLTSVKEHFDSFIKSDQRMSVDYVTKNKSLRDVVTEASKTHYDIVIDLSPNVPFSNTSLKTINGQEVHEVNKLSKSDYFVSFIPGCYMNNELEREIKLHGFYHALTSNQLAYSRNFTKNVMDELSNKMDINRFYEDSDTVFEGSSCQLSPREKGVFGRNLYLTSLINDVSFYSLFAVLDNEEVFHKFYEAQEQANNDGVVTQNYAEFLAESLFKSCQILLNSYKKEDTHEEPHHSQEL